MLHPCDIFLSSLWHQPRFAKTPDGNLLVFTQKITEAFEIVGVD